MEAKVIKKYTFVKSAESLLKSSVRWAKGGFSLADETLFSERKAICQTCQNWDLKAFAGSGKCKICGCSTKLKLKLKTEKCPLGKW